MTKTDFDSKLSNLNRKITSIKTEHVQVKNILNKLNIFDLSYFIGKSYFDEYDTKNYLILQPLFRYFKLNTKVAGATSSWKSRGLSSETIEAPSSLNIGLIVDLYCGGKFRVKFIVGYLKQPKVSYTHKKIVNIYLVYELGASSSQNNDPTLKTVYLVQLL